MDSSEIASAVARCDAWLDTMRAPEGYGGPVAHWWQNCLQYTGAGLDWRYEGIILGYLSLFEKTGDRRWLTKARRGGDDLLHGQLPSANYRNSSFELNPYPGGTPHEAACDLALLSLCRTLREVQDPGWEGYFAAAKNNIEDFYIARLWDDVARHFRDQAGVPSFVPNKAATLVEALIFLAEVSGHDGWVEAYALPTLDSILDHQVHGNGSDGAILQNSLGSKRVCKFFPYYIARCVPGLVCGYEWSGKEEYLDAALGAMAFVLRWRCDDGSFPQVIYPGGRLNRYPQWIAGVGDILRAIAVLKPYGFEVDTEPTESWLLQGQQPLGGIRTAHGFASQISQRQPRVLPEFRDFLPVCGWSDKAFRYLAEALPGNLDGEWPPDLGLQPLEAECTWRSQVMAYREDASNLELRRGGQVLYRWRKGAAWAEVCAHEMWWK